MRGGGGWGGGLQADSRTKGGRGIPCLIDVFEFRSRDQGENLIVGEETEPPIRVLSQDLGRGWEGSPRPQPSGERRQRQGIGGKAQPQGFEESFFISIYLLLCICSASITAT